MKKTIPAFLLSLLLFSINSMAQNWLTSGNALGANGTLGSTTNFSVVFKSNNSERGRLTGSGSWGFGTAAPNSKVHINGASGQIPLRVQVTNSTKLLVHSAGGVSVGSSLTPPANGLFVSGNVGIGINTPASKLDVAGTIIGFDSYFGKTYPISVGTSGASYSSVGYGLTFTNTTNTYGYRLNDFSSMLSFNSGGFDFNTAPKGTAGAFIPYTTAMAILQNGNVGIGRAIPDYKLVVTALATSHPVVYIKNTGGTDLSDGLRITAGSNTSTGAFFISFGRPDDILLGRIEQSSATSVSYRTTSDKRLKNIIGASQKGLSDLMKIKIYDYTFKSDPDKKLQTGFMAQELYEIFPQSVSKPRENNEPPEKNPWMVDYGSVTPLIIKSVQEQQQIIEQQQSQMQELSTKNADLQNQINDLKSLILKSGNGALVTSSTAFLKQNIPNPANNNTIISYYIPDNAGYAQIKITDVKGSLVKAFNAAKGDGQINIKSSELPSGTYNYTLYINNKTVDTKQMVLVK